MTLTVLFQREERVQRQIHAVYEAKKALKPYFMDKSINKDEYKLILKRSVDKVQHHYILQSTYLLFIFGSNFSSHPRCL